MCIICSAWEKGKLTTQEAARNLEELSRQELTDQDYKHSEELFQKLWNEFCEQINGETK